MEKVSNNGKVDNEVVIYLLNGIQSHHKDDEIIQFAPVWMELAGFL